MLTPEQEKKLKYALGIKKGSQVSTKQNNGKEDIHPLFTVKINGDEYNFFDMPWVVISIYL